MVCQCEGCAYANAMNEIRILQCEKNEYKEQKHSHYHY